MLTESSRIAARVIARKLNLDSLGIRFDDLMQEASIGILNQTEAIGKLDISLQTAAEVNAGQNAIVDYLRKNHGRTQELRAKRAALMSSAGDEPIEESDHWSQDPQRMVEAMEAWELTARLPVRLQMLATLFGVGYSSVEIADCFGVSEGRVSQLRTQLGKILGAMA